MQIEARTCSDSYNQTPYRQGEARREGPSNQDSTAIRYHSSQLCRLEVPGAQRQDLQ